jgi:transcriptional regulator with XRE-family HTH domain
MIRQHGCRYADRIVIPLSQREIARRLGISPGTLTWYLNELGDTVVARRPLLTFHPSLAETAGVTEPEPDPSATAGTVEGLLTDLIDAVEASNELLRLTLVELVDARDPNVVERATGSRARATGPRDSVARSEQKERDEVLLPGPSHSRDHLEQVARSRDDALSTKRLAELLAPLEAVVRRCRLVPVGDRSRVRRALASYSAEQIAAAVGRIVTDIGRGVPIRSPYGLLIHKAELADLDYFGIVHDSPVEPAPPADAGPEDEPDELDRLTDLALGEMDADPSRWAAELTELASDVDRYIRSKSGAATDTLLTCEPYRHAVRHDLYRARLAEETKAQ